MARSFTVDSVTNALKGAWQAIWAPRYNSDTIIDAIEAENNALYVADKTIHAGDRQGDSLTGQDHVCTAGEWKTETIAVTRDGDKEIWPGPCLVRSVRVRNTGNTGTATTDTEGIILVKDGSTVKDGAAAAKTPGSIIYDGLEGIIFASRFILNFASISDDGKIEVAYRPLDPNVTWTV